MGNPMACIKHDGRSVWAKRLHHLLHHRYEADVVLLGADEQDGFLDGVVLKRDLCKNCQLLESRCSEQRNALAKSSLFSLRT